MKDPIATIELTAVRSTGETFPVKIELGKPYLKPGEEPYFDCWACPVVIDGFEGILRDVVGDDSFHALMLAQYLIQLHLHLFVEAGGKFFYPDTEDLYPVEFTFPRVTLPTSDEPPVS